ncbi:hypothetical protein AAVH_42836, partial [Aphelenchoides avenae]
MTGALSFLDRDSLESLQLVSRQFQDAVAGGEMTRFAFRPISDVKCGKGYHVNTDDDQRDGIRVAGAIIARRRRQRKGHDNMSGFEFEREEEDDGSVVVSALSYLRASYCWKIKLNLTTDHICPLDNFEEGRILKALAGIAGTLVVEHLKVRVSSADAKFLQEFVGAFVAIRSLKITYGLMDPETYDATFFGACTARGLERLEFVEDEDLAYYYDQEDDDQEDEESDSDDDNEAADGNSVRPPKPRRFMDVRPFCFAPAPSGIRRYIDGWDVDEGTLVEACTKGLQ